MFAALVLSMAGARPIVIERGRDALSRKAAVDAFRAGGALDTECNVQFGEGGAGTFSDGKLNTGTHDARLFWVLRQFYAHGAPESVLYDAKPHIGTDILIDVVQRIRADVIARGGEVRFSTKLERLIIENGALTGIEVRDAQGLHALPCTQLILAIGHSARDTFEALHAQGVPMEPKPFSMGVRIEHRQCDIDLAQYGAARGAAARGGLLAQRPSARRTQCLYLLHVPRRRGFCRRVGIRRCRHERHELFPPRRGERQFRPARHAAPGGLPG